MSGLFSDPFAELSEKLANRGRPRVYEVTALETEAVLSTGEHELRLPLSVLPRGTEVGDVLGVYVKEGESAGAARQVVEAELYRAASGRPQTSAVQASLLYVLVTAVLAAFSHVLALVPFSSLDPWVQSLVRYGAIGMLALFTYLCARRMLLDEPPKLEELRNRYGRNDFLLWVLEQPTAENDDKEAWVFRQRWQHLEPRPVQAALIGIAVAGLGVVAGLPPVYGLVLVTTVCALFEVVRRRIFARWSATHRTEADTLVWSEAFSPYRDRLPSARVQLLRSRTQD